MAGGSSSNNDIFNNSAKPAKGTTEKKKRKRPSKKVPTTVLEASSNNFMNLVQKLTGSADELNYHVAAAPAKSTTPSPYPSPYSSPSNHTSQHEEQHSTYHHQYLPSTTTMDDDSGSSHNYNYNPAPYSSGSAYSHQEYAGMGTSAHPMDHHYQSNYGYYYGNHGSAGGGAGSTYVGSGSTGSRVGGDVDQDDDLYNQQGYGGHTRYNSNDHSSDQSYPARSRAMDQDDISPFSWRDPMNHNSTTSDYWYHVDPIMPAMRAS